MNAGVGADVESLCSTCGDVWHVVVAKVGEAVVKVQCKQCGKVHKPKPLPGAVVAKAPRRAASAKTERPTRRVATTRGTTVSIAVDLIFDPLKATRPYAPVDAFRPGEQLTHPTFGPGVVESVPAPGKVRVVFGDAIRVLVQARPGGQLERPAPRAVVEVEDEE